VSLTGLVVTGRLWNKVVLGMIWPYLVTGLIPKEVWIGKRDKDVCGYSNAPLQSV
jgi:hypothetical protein